jgi:hypothetical protein
MGLPGRAPAVLAYEPEDEPKKSGKVEKWKNGQVEK